MGRSKLDKFFVDMPDKRIRKMAIRDEERKRIIYPILKDNAYRTKDGYYLIDYWRLVEEINNIWQSFLFVNMEKYKSRFVEFHGRLGLEKTRLYLLRRQLSNFIKRIGGEIIVQGYNRFYKLKQINI